MELLGIMISIVKTLSSPQTSSSSKDAKTVLMNCKDWVDVIRKLATLQNSYNPSEMRTLALGRNKRSLFVLSIAPDLY